jgi:hypothetical protein
MAYPIQQFKQSYRDYNREISHLRLWATTLTAGNFAAQATLAASLSLSLLGITNGRLASHEYAGQRFIDSALPGATVNSQRENKWLCRYHDANGKKFSVEVPCANLTLLDTNSDFIDVANAAWTGLVTDFQAYVVSPDDSSAVTLDSGQFVGRKL